MTARTRTWLWDDPSRPPGLMALGAEVLSGTAPEGLTVWDFARDLAFRSRDPHPWQGEYLDVIEGMAAHSAVLLRLAERWLARTEHPWLAPLDPDRQAWVALSRFKPVPQPPTEAGFVSPVGCADHLGALAPARGGISTSTLLYDDSVGRAPDEWAAPGETLWRLPVAHDATVLEIATQADWTALVERFPAPIDPRASTERVGPRSLQEGDRETPVYGVDWGLAAREVDGVRLRVDAQAAVAFVQVPVLDGVTVYLPDVVYDETIWLRWVFGTPEEIGPWDARDLRDPSEQDALPSRECGEALAAQATSDPALAAALEWEPQYRASYGAVPLTAVRPMKSPPLNPN